MDKQGKQVEQSRVEYGPDVDFVSLHNLVSSDGRPHFSGLCIPVPTGLHIRAWEKHLWDYEDKEIINFVNFG